MKLKPRPHQVESIEFLKSHQRCILALDMGLGKTASSLLALGDRGLVVCPPALKFGWSDECKKWRPDLKPIVMEGMGLARFKWPGKGELVICGYNQLPDWLLPPPSRCGLPTSDKSKKAKQIRKELKERRKKFNTFMESQERFGRMTPVVYDEVQALKTMKSKRGRKGRMLSMLCQTVWGLTGTPMPRGGASDLYGILSGLVIENEVFRNFPHFQDVANYRRETSKYGTPKPEFHRLLKEFMFRKTKAEVAPDLPKKVYQTLKVPLDKRSKELLATLPPELIEKIENAQDASELTKLQSLPEFSEFSACRRDIARARIPKLLEILDIYEQNGTRVLVFSAHREPIEALMERPGWATIRGGDAGAEARQQIVRDQESFKGIGITIRAGSAGLNLQSFEYVIFVDLDWDVTNNLQAEDRCHRMTSTCESVNYTILSSDHPVDALITRKIFDATRNISVAIDGAE